MRHQLREFCPQLEAAQLENAVSIGVAGCHSESGITLVGGVGRQILTQRHSLLELGGHCRGCWARQRVTCGQNPPLASSQHRVCLWLVIIHADKLKSLPLL